MDPIRSPIPLEEMEPAARPVHTAVGLPPACYTDADFYAFEKAAGVRHRMAVRGPLQPDTRAR